MPPPHPQSFISRVFGSFYSQTRRTPSVTTSGTDDSMDGMDFHQATSSVPSVPRTAHHKRQQSGSQLYGTEDGQHALSLIAENGSLQTGSESSARSDFHHKVSTTAVLKHWLDVPHRHERIACGVTDFPSLEDLEPQTENLKALSRQIEPNVDPHIFIPYAGAGYPYHTKLELPLHPKVKVPTLHVPEISRKFSDVGSHFADPKPEAGLENITELHHQNFRESLSILAQKDHVLASTLIRRLGSQVNLILPLFDGHGLEDLLLSGRDGITEHAQSSQPAQAAGSHVPNAGFSTSKEHRLGESKRRRVEEGDDNENDENSKRNEQDDPPPAPRSGKATRPRFKCPFNAKCPIAHCWKNRRQCKSQGFDTIHHLRAHMKEYHTVVRCQRCYKIFEGLTAVSIKNDHQRTCNTMKPLIADDVIDCDMKVKLNEQLAQFRTYSVEIENDLEMKSWILTNASTLSGITGSRPELPDAELKKPSDCERELAKWYSIWRTLFGNLAVPQHPFYEQNIPQAVQQKQRFLFLYRQAVNAKAETRGPPQVDYSQAQREWYDDCLSDTLDLLILPSTENISTQGEMLNAKEQLISGPSSAVGMQGMLSILAPQRNQPSPSQPVVRDHSDQQTSRLQIDPSSISDAIASHSAPGQAPTPMSNATFGHPLSGSQYLEAMVPTPTTMPHAQSYPDPDPYGHIIHSESQEPDQGQGQNQTPPLGDFQPPCDRCLGSRKVWYFGSSTTEGWEEDCPLCIIYTPAIDHGDIYNA